MEGPDTPLWGMRTPHDEHPPPERELLEVEPDGRALARNGLRYELLKVETRYQWYRQDGIWNYEPIKRTRRIANGIDEHNPMIRPGATEQQSLLGLLPPPRLKRRRGQQSTLIFHNRRFPSPV